MQTIADRLKSVKGAIQNAAVLAHREPNSVQLLAVSKTKSVSEITQAYELGQRKFGENYVQEGVTKITQLHELPGIEWHMIGPIQSNKTKDVATHFAWVQSIDRIKIAKRLNDQRPPHLPDLNICIQVNIDNEATKAGVTLNELDDFIGEINTLNRLRLRGLMAIPAANVSEQQQSQSFNLMHEQFTLYQQQYAEFDTLSLGMSNDMQLAIAHGSTMVRLGTAIFGSR